MAAPDLSEIRAHLGAASTLLQRAGRLAEQMDAGWSQLPLVWDLRATLAAIDQQIAAAGQIVAGQQLGAGRAGGAGV